ncbi:recombinase family protein [Bacillus pumilus]|uniref:recombinase family protein n=1 Tax=Bacillus pumilus TaxID=1408 RepID=UPI0034561EBA
MICIHQEDTYIAKQYGYARFSTAEQSLEAQIQALKEAEVSEIFKDKATDINTRKAYKLYSVFLDVGKILVITKLDEC